MKPNGAVEGNPVNNPSTSTPNSHSTFNLGYHFFDTHRFGEYHPHYVAEGVKNDELPIRSSHEVLTYTLKAPLMQNITMHKDYFLVPDQAILPLNWDKFFENPVRGDDVSVDVGPTVTNFFTRVSDLCQAIRSSLTGILEDSTKTAEQGFTALFRYLITLEYFYSNGSLLTSLGCHAAPYFNSQYKDPDTGFVKRVSFDFYFDNICRYVEQLLQSDNDSYMFNLQIDDITYFVRSSVDYTYSYSNISFRHALSLMRDNPHFIITAVNDSSQALNTLILGRLTGDFPVTAFEVGNIPYNLSRLWAYQLCVAHYFSNDSIDFIYSAELFRQLVGYYGTGIVNSQGVPSLEDFFSYNGVKYRYDNLSAHWFNKIFSFITNTVPTSFLGITSSATNINNVNCCLGYLSALFSYRRSLRYMDYFTGSRAHPLAVGNVGVAVVNNQVDVINITQNIQKQRFLNAVNRVRHTTEDYLKGVFGGSLPAPDYHNPFMLCATKDVVFGQEVENTGEAQMTRQIAITTNLRSNGSRYMFEISCDRPCVILGLTYYDIPRSYSKSIERPLMHQDRFDYFNPYMQFIGDQPIYKQELGVGIGSPLLNFSYTLRHMEYKQRYNQVAGGFVEYLPGFAFIAQDARVNEDTINPDFIRSNPSELDNFFVSLTGYSLGSYWHFIVDTFNDTTGKRPMVYAPSIL